MKNKLLLTISLVLSLASCSEDKETSKKGEKSSEDKKKTSQQESADNGALAGLVLKSAPGEALDIAVLRKTAKLGETVTFTGEVIGADPVFMDGRAVMIMGDPKKLTSCDKIPGDECVTPWDVCCDDPDVVTASIVTVQVVDESGRPVKASLKGVGGLKEISLVTVTGEVAKASNDKNMLINATGLFVHATK